MDIRNNRWVHKYKPKNFEEIILNEDIKPKLQKALIELPNLLLYGTSGLGKGCFANLFKEMNNIDYMWINASDENGIDIFRNKIKPFATAMCMKDMKIIVLNECDSLTSGPQGSQKLLRQLIEDCYRICRFILICNYENYLIPELKSRFSIIQFGNPPKKEIGKLCLNILRKEKVKFDSKHVIDIITKCYPDIRRTIEALQENVINGKLIGSNVYASEEIFKKILNYMILQDFDNVREELKSNYIAYEYLYEYLYNNAGEFKQPGAAILIIGEYLYRNSSIANKEINFMSMMMEMILKKVI